MGNIEGIFSSFGLRCSRIDRAILLQQGKGADVGAALAVALQGQFLAALEELIFDKIDYVLRGAVFCPLL